MSFCGNNMLNGFYMNKSGKTTPKETIGSREPEEQKQWLRSKTLCCYCRGLAMLFK